MPVTREPVRRSATQRSCGRAPTAGRLRRSGCSSQSAGRVKRSDRSQKYRKFHGEYVAQ